MLKIFQSSSAPRLNAFLLAPGNHLDPLEDVIGDQQGPENYTQFLLDHCNERPSDVLSILIKERRRNRMRTHIWMCNSMIRSGRRFFRTENLAQKLRGAAQKDEGIGFARRFYNLGRPNTRAGHGGEEANEGELEQWNPLLRNEIEARESVGICTSRAQVGDIVLLVSGVHVPLVVRPSAAYVHLVSPAIVIGAMTGEVWVTEGEEEDLQEYVIS
jgi:hypothetical protein